MFFASPGARQRWPNSAACWSPALPLIGAARPNRDDSSITPAQGITARAAQAGVNVTTVQGSAGDLASPTLVPS